VMRWHDGVQLGVGWWMFQDSPDSTSLEQHERSIGAAL
jgi:hypothetical protein